MKTRFQKVFVFLLYSTGAGADWCDGKQFVVFQMPLSERVAEAGKALQHLQAEFRQEALRSQLDLQRQGDKVRTELTGQFRQLSEQTIGLCQATDAGDFPITYQGVLLEGREEATAQMRLNLGLLRVQRDALNEFDGWQLHFRHTVEALRRNESEVAILLKQFEHQQSGTGQALEAEGFLRNACIVVHQGQDLLQQKNGPSLDGLLSERLKRLAAVDTLQLEQFVDSCELPGDADGGKTGSWLKKLVGKFKVLF